MTIDFNNPSQIRTTAATTSYRVDMRPLTDTPLSDVMPTPSAQEVSALQNYYGQVQDDVDNVRNLGNGCTCGYSDAGAGQAIENFKQTNPDGPIDATQIYRLIEAATKDADNNAAGGEFKDLQSFVEKNWNRMDDKARAVWQVYYQQVMDSRNRGKTGIDHQDYEQMLGKMRQAGGIQDDDQECGEYKDASAGAAIKKLEGQNPNGPISGDQMLSLILEATQDMDNQAASKEYEDLSKFVQKNYARLSPEAKEIWELYQRNVQQSQAEGNPGIPTDRFDRMIRDMTKIQQRNQDASGKYEDPSAGDAIESLQARVPNGPISGNEMRRLVLDAIKDYDSQSTSTEFSDLERFVSSNKDRLSPEAKQIWEIYSQAVQNARARGEQGIQEGDYQEMIARMRDVLG